MVCEPIKPAPPVTKIFIVKFFLVTQFYHSQNLYTWYDVATMDTYEPEKITIVEGPPPLFEPSIEHWAYAIGEGPVLKRAVRCMLRTMNGTALLERCRGAWREGRETMLEYRTMDGLRQEAVILAARKTEWPEGEVLLLWVRLDQEIELTVDEGDTDSDADADDNGEA
jgi:hypothetical protein